MNSDFRLLKIIIAPNRFTKQHQIMSVNLINSAKCNPIACSHIRIHFRRIYNNDAAACQSKKKVEILLSFRCGLPTLKEKPYGLFAVLSLAHHL